MAQALDLSVVEITNPTSEDFTQRWNGEPYLILAGEQKSFAKPVAYHIAKHLSTKMVINDVLSKASKKDMDNPHAAVHVQVSQLSNNDTHERRIALYKILKDGQKVLDVIQRYPFKGFIGEMSEYEAFVEKASKKEESVAEPKPEKASKTKK